MNLPSFGIRAKQKEKEKEKHEKTLEKQKAWEKSVPSHKVIQQDKIFKNTFENMCLVEQPQSFTFCKGTLASISKKEESLKEACIDKDEVNYFSYVLGYLSPSECQVIYKHLQKQIFM